MSRTWIAMSAALLTAALTQGAAVAQDAAAGEKVFGACKACHQIGPTPRTPLARSSTACSAAARPHGCELQLFPLPTRRSTRPGQGQFRHLHQGSARCDPRHEDGVWRPQDEQKIADLIAYLDHSSRWQQEAVIRHRWMHESPALAPGFFRRAEPKQWKCVKLP